MKSTSLSKKDINASTMDQSEPSDEDGNIDGTHSRTQDFSVRKEASSTSTRKEAGSTSTASSRVTTRNASVDIKESIKTTIVTGVIPATSSVSSSCTQGIPSVTSVSAMSVTSDPVVAVSGNTSGGLSVNMPLPIHMVAAPPSSVAATIAPTGTQTTTTVTSCGAAASVTSWTPGVSTSSSGNSGGHLTVPLVGGGTAATLATLSYVHGTTGIRLIPATAVSGLHPGATVAATVGLPVNTLVREVRRCSDSSRAQETITEINLMVYYQEKPRLPS